MKIRLHQQIEEVRHALDHVYPHLRALGYRNKSVLELHTARMKAVLATLEWFQQNEDVVRGAVRDASEG